MTLYIKNYHYQKYVNKLQFNNNKRKENRPIKVISKIMERVNIHFTKEEINMIHKHIIKEIIMTNY